ncbi:MAG TPA: tetratricopeptide repeat protein [Anaerolineales bacterium]|nr:tetratricopeptide repeat protein [Anaerolineales bacterium]
MSMDDDFISKTKVILPRRRMDLLSRPRLLEILYERLDRKLIIISAAAGYGKTSLLIDLAYHSELPFCWLQLDALDREPQRFIAGLIASLTERFRGFGGRSQSALTSMTSLDESMERILVTLVNEIYDEIHEHFVLVLDDFHVLDEAPPILYFVNRFIQLVGENCHVVLSSRTLPELQDIALLVAREDVGGLDFTDLSFQPHEIQALLAQNRQVRLSEEDARKLVDATEGWVTGLQFADLDDLAARSSSLPGVPRKVGVTVFDYLGQQVLEQQPPELQDFLLRSSMLDEFNVKLCQVVLGPSYAQPPDWYELVATITQKNLFTQPVGPNGQWVRYHHLFRDYLQENFRRKYPDEVEPILRRLAQFEEGIGQWESAYQIYTQLDDTEALAGLVERAGIPMYQHARLTLESWLKSLPPSVIGKRPGLLSLRGNIELVKGNAGEGLKLFDRAIAAFRRTGDDSGLALALVRRGGAYRFLGRYDDAVQDADDVLTISESHDDLQWLQADALRIKGLCRLRQGSTSDALNYLQHAYDVCVRVNDVATMPQLLMETGVVQSAIGNHAESKSSYDKALKIWREEQNLSQLAVLLNNYGFLHQQLGEYEEAATCLEEGLLYARQSGDRRMEALIALSLGDVYAEVEDFDVAAQNYRQAADQIEQLGDPFLQNYLSLVSASLALLKGDLREARYLIDSAAVSVQGSPSNYDSAFLQLLRGRFELQSGMPARALPELMEARRLFVLDGREAESVCAAIWLAAAEYEAERFVPARAEIKAVIPNTNQVPYAAVLTARQARHWLGRLRRDADLRPHLRVLFERADRLEDKLPPVRRQLRRLAHTIEVPTPSLIIRAFGAGQVWVNGNLITAREWQTQSVRELFFFLLETSRPLTREQIGAALWPGTEEPLRLKMRFKNEIYRLRRAVGLDTILVDGETYRFGSADHEYDVEAFQAYLRKARSALRAVDRIDFYERAIDLVQGRYLEDINAAWVNAEQERLHQAFLSAVMALAELYQKEGHTPKAVELCQRALSLDRTAEPVYRLLMQIFSRMGDRASVVHIFQNCEAVMKDVFGLPPSQETQEMYRKMTS